MKKILGVICFFILLGFSGCSNNSKNTNKENKSNKAETEYDEYITNLQKKIDTFDYKDLENKAPKIEDYLNAKEKITVKEYSHTDLSTNKFYIEWEISGCIGKMFYDKYITACKKSDFGNYFNEDVITEGDWYTFNAESSTDSNVEITVDYKVSDELVEITLYYKDTIK